MLGAEPELRISCTKLYASNLARPKYRSDSKLVHRANDATDVMTENFAQDFVSHRRVGLAPNVVAEFGLNHHHGRFNVAALVIVREKLLSVEREVMEHLLPRRALAMHPCCVGFERDVRSCVQGDDSLKVLRGDVSPVSQDLLDVEVFSGLGHQCRKYRSVIRLSVTDFDSSDNVRFHPAGFAQYLQQPASAQIAKILPKKS